MAPLLLGRAALGPSLSLRDSVWHRLRPLQGRGAPGDRNTAAWPELPETLQRVPSRKHSSPSVCPDVRLPPRTCRATVYEISGLDEARQIKAHLTDGSYRTWYKAHLDNSIYLPLVEQTLSQTMQNGL